MNNSKWRYILGTTTIFVIIGGTIYAIKKSKDAKKLEEREITLEEAKAEVQAHRERKAREEVEEIADLFEYEEDEELANLREDEMHEASEEFDEMMEEIRDTADWNSSFMGREDKGELEDEEEIEDEPSQLEEEEFRYIEEGINPKEDTVLRYEPSSVDARHQFIRMELADWTPTDDVYHILLKLFDFPFRPENDGDFDLYTRLLDNRVQFFGFESKWVKDVSYADLILHYAKAAQYNCDETVRYWVEYFLEFNEFDSFTPSHVIDDLLRRLNSHTYFNEERATFGLFGLTRESMDNAIKIADRNVDNSVTYEIEFNEFLKSCF